MSPEPCDRQFTIQVTGRTLQFLDQLAERQHTSRAEVVRQAIREYLNTQEDVIASRTRQSRRLMVRLDELENRFLEQQVNTSTLLLAAIILLRMKQGDRGNEVLEQIEQLAAHVGGEIRVVFETER